MRAQIGTKSGPTPRTKKPTNLPKNVPPSPKWGANRGAPYKVSKVVEESSTTTPSPTAPEQVSVEVLTEAPKAEVENWKMKREKKKQTESEQPLTDVTPE